MIQVKDKVNNSEQAEQRCTQVFKWRKIYKPFLHPDLQRELRSPIHASTNSQHDMMSFIFNRSC